MTRGRREAEQLLGTLQRALVPTARPNPILLAWRWRYELAIAAGIPLAIAGLIAAIGPSGAVAVATVVTALLLGWPAARRHLVARAWCLVTPHRFRAACTQGRIHTRSGRLPAVVWCAPKSYGEQLLIWCPAGITAGDLTAACAVLASACYATAVEVVEHPRYRHLVLVGVIRHQPG
ncbi:MAG: hypothetical protein ACRDRZ_17415 [Pseudonocardiaceae bacterium]